jgi:hypothetical protein
MCKAVADCLVTGYEALVPGLTLPDADDRHVLAAAIRCGAQVIVTNNVTDFPAQREGLETVLDRGADHGQVRALLVDLAPEAVIDALTRQAGSLKNPAQTVLQLLETLERNGLKKSVAVVRRLLPESG